MIRIHPQDPVFVATPRFMGLCAAVLLIILAGWSLRTSPEQIKDCETQTGWSKERCVNELSR